MDGRYRLGIATAVLLLATTGLTSAQTYAPSNRRGDDATEPEAPARKPVTWQEVREQQPALRQRAANRDAAVRTTQAPAPTTPSANPPQTPARPAQPRPATPDPNAPATTDEPGSTALATPTTPTNPTTSSFAGSNLFAQQNSAFALAGNRRPSRTVEFQGDNVGGVTLARLGFASPAARFTPPTPPSPPGIPSPNPPGGPTGNYPHITRHGAILAPAVRAFKIAEMQTPRPVDRVYFFTNYFNDVNKQINQQYGSQVGSIQVYRNTFGFEKTFMDGRASIGAQLPLNTIALADRYSKFTGTTTTVGDLSLISKFALWSDDESGSIISAGLAFTAPTGPSYFGGNRTVTNLHFAGFTPYIGYIWAFDRFFFQGFNSVSVPTSSQDVTYAYNDFGIGYYVYRDDDEDGWLTALVPTFETHVNTPLNHRGGYLRDPAGTPDVVDLTYGLNAFIREHTKVSFGVVTPVTGPRPFSYEIIGNLTYRF